MGWGGFWPLTMVLFRDLHTYKQAGGHVFGSESDVSRGYFKRLGSISEDGAALCCVGVVDFVFSG